MYICTAYDVIKYKKIFRKPRAPTNYQFDLREISTEVPHVLYFMNSRITACMECLLLHFAYVSVTGFTLYMPFAAALNRASNECAQKSQFCHIFLAYRWIKKKLFTCTATPHIYISVDSLQVFFFESVFTTPNALRMDPNHLFSQRELYFDGCVQTWSDFLNIPAKWKVSPGYATESCQCFNIHPAGFINRPRYRVET